MRRLRSRFAVCMLAASLSVAVVSTPGCQQVAQFLYKLIIKVAQDVVVSKIGIFVEQKLDEWLFDKSDSRNSGGDVVTDSGSGTSGTYNGTMQITVREEATGKVSNLELTNPRMRRESSSSKWKLDPAIIQKAKERTQESFGQ